MLYTVEFIIDGDTFTISPNWDFKGLAGNHVRPTGYDAPELIAPGGEAAKEKLSRLIKNKEIELRNPVTISYGRLVCDVLYQGKSLADYFPEH